MIPSARAFLTAMSLDLSLLFLFFVTAHSPFGEKDFVTTALASGVGVAQGASRANLIEAARTPRNSVHGSASLAPRILMCKGTFSLRACLSWVIYTYARTRCLRLAKPMFARPDARNHSEEDAACCERP